MKSPVIITKRMNKIKLEYGGSTKNKFGNIACL